MNFREARSRTALRESGECIYCGSKDDFSDEHVIPFALGGNLCVPKASCPICRDLTSRFERKVLRGFMYRARIVGNYPSYRRRERPDQVSVTLLDGNAPREISLPRQAGSAVLQLPTFERAGFLSGNAKMRGINVCGLETIQFGADLNEAVRVQGATGFRQTDDIAVTEFARMLAKIGYSFTVGVFGTLPLSNVLVLPFIRGETDDAGCWIGSAQFDTESEKRGALHGLTHTIYRSETGTAKDVLVARIKLFASAGATGYEVVVCEMSDAIIGKWRDA